MRYEQVHHPEQKQELTVAESVELKLEDLLEQKRKLTVEQGQGLHQHELHIKSVLEHLSPEEIRSIYTEVLQEIGRTTKFFDEYKEADVLGYILNNFDEDHKPLHVKSIEWGAELKKGIAGVFDPSSRRIRMAAQAPPTGMEMLCSLVAEGSFSQHAQTLNHEATHGYQFPDLIRQIGMVFEGKCTVLELLQSYHASADLQEAHAQRFGAPVTHSRDDANYTILFSGHYKVDWTKVPYAIATMEQLKALGLSSQEVGELVYMHGQWDESKREYPRLEALVAKRARKYFKYDEQMDYIPKPYDYVADLENLIQVHHLELSIAHLQAQKIAQDAVYDYLPEYLKKRTISYQKRGL